VKEDYKVRVTIKIKYMKCQCKDAREFIRRLRKFQSEGWTLIECSLYDKWFKIKHE
jgi:uncharacterized protein YlaN (UPF0358 family)